MKKSIAKDNKKTEHIPIMVEEVLGLVPEKAGSTVVDCTLGTGGHSFAILRKLKKSTLLGIDLDEDQIDYVFDKAARKGFKATRDQNKGFWGWKLEDKKGNTVHLVKSNFMFLGDICKKLKIKKADLVLFDLGFSTFQLEESKRGFTYTGNEELLDQRYNATEGWKAVDLVNTLSKKDLETALREFGEERYASEIAQAIVQEREEQPIETNTQLINLIRKTVGSRYERGKHPAMRTFQALRISVNNELVSLASALPQAFDLIAGTSEKRAAGKMALITFNSLERKTIEKFVAEEKSAEVSEKTKSKLSEVAKNPKSHNALMYIIEYRG